MNKTFTGILMFFVLAGTLSLTASAQDAKRLEEIKALYSNTNAQIAESNADGENSSIYLAEIFVNKNNGSYPAVGLFRTVYKFYYTYGDREKNPYPNRLQKIEIETARSDRTEKREFLFDENARLVFYFEKKNEGETPVEKRIYFQNEKAFRFLTDDQTNSLTNAETAKTIKFVLAEKRKLTAMFQNSLDY